MSQDIIIQDDFCDVFNIYAVEIPCELSARIFSEIISTSKNVFIVKKTPISHPVHLCEGWEIAQFPKEFIFQNQLNAPLVMKAQNTGRYYGIRLETLEGDTIIEELQQQKKQQHKRKKLQSLAHSHKNVECVRVK